MIILALILAAAVYGFAAANTVPDTYAGDGSGTISGYYICNLVYTLGSPDPSTITALSFELYDDVACTTPANASSVFVSFTGGTPYADCSPSPADYQISCSGLTQSVLGASSLRVIASN
jgi:hypothetical protein